MSDALNDAIARRSVRATECVRLRVYSMDKLPAPDKAPERPPALTKERARGLGRPGVVSTSEEGAEAKRKGKSASTNPYDFDTAPSLHREWLKGYRG